MTDCENGDPGGAEVWSWFPAMKKMKPDLKESRRFKATGHSEHINLGERIRERIWGACWTPSNGSNKSHQYDLNRTVGESGENIGCSQIT